MIYLRILGNVFRRPRYVVIALVVAWMVFSGAVWWSNVALIWSFAQSSSVSDLITLLYNLYWSIGTNFTLVAATYTSLIALLFGMQVALLTYYVRQIRTQSDRLRGVGATSAGGFISGALGIGCAACGTFILSSTLALFGAAGVVSFLPFGGEEFGFIGVALLGYSIYATLKRLRAPFVCPV